MHHKEDRTHQTETPIGLTLNSLYYVMLESVDALKAIGYATEVQPKREGSLFTLREKMAEARTDQDHDLLIETPNLNVTLLGDIITLLVDDTENGEKAYNSLRGLLKKYGLHVPVHVNNADARTQVVYSLRAILVPKKISGERRRRIRQKNAKAHMSQLLSQDEEKMKGVRERMGNRGYFPQWFETDMAKELTEIFLDPNKRKPFEVRWGGLNRNAVVAFIEQKAAELDELLSNQYYNGYGPNERKVDKSYVHDFLHSKEHTKGVRELFQATRTVFALADHPTVNFEDVFRNEIVAPDRSPQFTGHLGGFSRMKITRYLMEHYGKIEVLDNDGGPLTTIELFVDDDSIKRMLKRIGTMR